MRLPLILLEFSTDFGHTFHVLLDLARLNFIQKKSLKWIKFYTIVQSPAFVPGSRKQMGSPWNLLGASPNAALDFPKVVFTRNSDFSQGRPYTDINCLMAHPGVVSCYAKEAKIF